MLNNLSETTLSHPVRVIFRSDDMPDCPVSFALLKSLVAALPVSLTDLSPATVSKPAVLAALSLYEISFPIIRAALESLAVS
jgi:hypothetical protein